MPPRKASFSSSLDTDLLDGFYHGDCFTSTWWSKDEVGRGAGRPLQDVSYGLLLLLVTTDALVKEPGDWILCTIGDYPKLQKACYLYIENARIHLMESILIINILLRLHFPFALKLSS